MDFSQRKLPKEAASRLRSRSIQEVRPFALMLAPAYVLMKLNEKFVMVKKALDFFTEEELARLHPFETVFIGQEAEGAKRFREVAEEVRSLLSWKPASRPSSAGKGLEEVLPPASYEVSDAAIRLIAPLWKRELQVDPFLVAVFVNELCESLPVDLLRSNRDRDVVRYEKAIIASSWAVFLALHLGYVDLPFLNHLRREVFREAGAGHAADLSHSEIKELVSVAKESLGGAGIAGPGACVSAARLTQGSGRTSQKLSSRIRRVERLIVDV